MRDVAALAGVSLKTVSRVVNDEPGVKPDTVERVREAARKLEYQHNLTASSLRRRDGRTNIVGLLLEDIANPFSSSIYRAVEDRARERGVSVLAGSLEEIPAREVELTAELFQRRIDGLIIAPSSRDHSYLQKEQRQGTAMVFIDRPPVLLAADTVLSDATEGVLSGIRQLLELGHKRIGYLGDAGYIVTAHDRVTAYQAAIKVAGLPHDPALVQLDVSTIESAHAATLALLDLAQPPTALFTGQNLITIGAVRALRERNLQHDVALIGFDDFLLADLLEPAVTVVAQDPSAVGSEAARLLFARIDGAEGDYEHIVVPTRLIRRGSGEIKAR
jgi:LacI family transcriptional regulator